MKQQIQQPQNRKRTLCALIAAATLAAPPVGAQYVGDDWDPGYDEEREAEEATSHIPNAPNMGGPAPDVGLATGGDEDANGSSTGNVRGEAYPLEDRRAAGVTVPEKQSGSNEQMPTGESRNTRSGTAASAMADIYTTPVDSLMAASVLNEQGDVVGQVQEVVLMNDSHDAALIVAPAGDAATGTSEGNAQENPAEALLVPVGRVSMQNGNIVMNDSLSSSELQTVQSLGNDAFRLAPETNAPLHRLINRQPITAR